MAAAVLVLWILVPHVAATYTDVRAHLDPSYESPLAWGGTWSESKRLTEVAEALPSGSIVLTNSNRPPVLRYWTRSPVYYANLVRHPYHRGEPLPGSHTNLGLVIAHLRELYGDQLPPAVYLYFFAGGADRAYASDPILWQLVDGQWSSPTTVAQFANFQKLATIGIGNSSSPVVAAGDDWIAFEADRVFENPPPGDAGMPPPTRAEFGPPW